ncbi:MAG TPA: hypothetical protein VIJ14_07900 [Rhabdochlamydiaceae bacterium]
MKFLLPLIFLLSCGRSPDNELGGITHDVLKTKEGVDIKITPVETERLNLKKA